MICAAILASFIGGAAAQYYFGDIGSFVAVSAIWVTVFLWRSR